MFSDVNPLLRTLKTEAGEEHHLRKMIWVERIFTDKHNYEQGVFAVLPQLRHSVMRTIARAERLSLLKMFSIHIVDVVCSIIAALLAVRILELFENGGLPGSAGVWEIAQQSVLIALAVFGLNVLAASLHAQKIERETLVVFRVQTTLARWLNTFVLNMSRQAKARFPTGDIVNVAQTDARHVAEFFAHAAVDFPVLFVSVTLIVAVMWTIVGSAAFVALGILLLQIPVSLFFSWLGQKLHGELMRRSDRRLSLVTEWVQAARLMRYFGWTQHMARDIRIAAQREFRQDLKMKAHYSTSFGLSTSWWMLVALGVFAGFLWFHLDKSASQVFAAIWLSSILGQQLNPLPWFVRIFSEAQVGSRRLEAIFIAPIQAEEFASRGFSVPDDVAAQLNAAHEIRNISFDLRDVWVEWPGVATPALQGVSCRFPAAHLSAIVGPVGAGKSLLLQTLMGEITPTRGEVLLECDAVDADGHSTRLIFPIHCERGLAALRRVQTFVPQEAFVAAASVRENVPLTYLNDGEFPSDFDAQIVRALERAQLSTDVQTLPDGLKTELGERGVNLSGGQKQRLSLARAIYAKRPLVVLDDPLSAVDTETEDKLVGELFGGCWRSSTTIIWATHRLAHLSLARHIVVLDGGQLVEQGDWQSLSQPGTRLSSILSSLKQNAHQKNSSPGDESA